MQTKTIKKAIKLKLESWLESITDVKLRDDLRDNVLVSGGSITSMLLNDTVNDFDIYLMDRNVLLRLTHYYVDPIDGAKVWDGHKYDEIVKEHSFANNSAAYAHSYLGSSIRNLKPEQVKIFIESNLTGGLKVNAPLPLEGETEPKPYHVTFLSPNAISLSDEIQIVVRFHGTPEQIHSTFDFIHATNYFTFQDGVVTNLKALESVLSKQLFYQGSQYPLTSVIRAKKFLKRNWNIGAGEYLKMMFQISLLDLQNIDVLEEQLIGIDVAYFGALIRALREHAERNPNTTISAEFMNSIIDKIFQEED